MTDLTMGVSGTKPEEEAAKDLARACYIVASHTTVERMALQAYVQALMTQCTVQVIVDLMLRKNVFGDAQMGRELADAYRDMTRSIQNSQLLAPPRATVGGVN